MSQVQQLLQVSARLYQHLSEIPHSDQRDAYIETINIMLDEREGIIYMLREEGFLVDTTNRAHTTLVELDKGIRERLSKVMDAVKHDMKDLQNQKKNEKQYMNPYSDVRVMDGMYYDKKK
ncbi:flagellar protein FliT [Solibacillus sp. FSL H8-0538]|uniref:flagellar protein FliT n=1 Tax=Solibacillus sp. FSL H8-0538 TaxID=2921400 RepID=UPI0030FA9F49